MKDKKKNKKLLEESAIFNPKNKYSKKQNSGTTAIRTKQLEQNASTKQKNNIFLDYPQKYQIQAEFFEEKIDKSALSKHRFWNHDIPLISRK